MQRKKFNPEGERNTTTTCETIMIKNIITPREIQIVSDCGNYIIKGRLVSERDSYTQDNWLSYKTYTGSHWVAGMYDKTGQRINGIHVCDGNYQPYITIDNVCCHGIKLSKNTILFTAIATHMFKNALTDVDIKAVEKKYYKEYVDARIKEEYA